MRDVVIYWVPHVLRKDVLKSLLIEEVVVKDLNQHVKEAFILIGVETDLEYLVRLASLVASTLRLQLILVFKDVVEDPLYH